LLLGFRSYAGRVGLICNGHVWPEVLVLVCSKLTPKLTLLIQTHVLVWC
jgi:hypothetical protein